MSETNATTEQLQSQVADLQAQLAARHDALAVAESQRDEANARLVEADNRIAAERMLAAAGVADLETAGLLLGKRLDLSQELEPAQLTAAVEQLLLDKPLLRGGAASAALPAKTGAARVPQASLASQLAQAAQRAVRTGDRRAVAEYLRLRRAAADAGRRR